MNFRRSRTWIFFFGLSAALCAEGAVSVAAEGRPWSGPPKPPPAVVEIDVGRQLLVDDYLIEATTLSREFHRPVYHPACPVLRPDRPWEDTMAMPFSDGVWFDPADQLFKIWYFAGQPRVTCYATSRDGVHWEKPLIDVRPGTNIVLAGKRDSGSIILDLNEKDPTKRYKLFRSHNRPHPLGYEKGMWGLSLHYSADGIHWTDTVRRTGWVGDRSTVFYNPFRSAWVYSLRNPDWSGPRQRFYWESTDLEREGTWDLERSPPLPWVKADEFDPPYPGTRIPAQLYNVDAVAYESLLVGMFTILRGDVDNRTPVEPGRPKPNSVCVAFSRDGFHWSRPDRRPFLDYSAERAWNWGNVQSVGGVCAIVGDKLFFYTSGRAGSSASRDDGGSTGLAILRRDGFASLNAGVTEETLTTRPLRFSGAHLFVNVAAANGELAVEALEADGTVVPEFSREKCETVRVDSTLQRVQWRGVTDLAKLQRKPVRFRFFVRHASLYSFWVGATESGASGGYVAAGGPGYTSHRDTVGRIALDAAQAIERQP